MINKTKDYDIFQFRDDNRERINQEHLKRLIASIKGKNLLDLRPIVVNERMEVIDGQHRLLAAKQLGVEIYYQKHAKLGAEEVLLMNTTKAWGCADFLNYYVKNGYTHYIKLNEFIKTNGLNIRVALNICMGASKYSYAEYKEGKFIFHEEASGEELDICWDTINYIEKMNGYSQYTKTVRFWSALLKLIRHQSFDFAKWKVNLSRMVERFTAKATAEDYCRLMMEIYNWRNAERVNLLEEVFA